MSDYALLAKATEQIHPNPEVAMDRLQREFDTTLGAYFTAKKYGVLVNNSAEEFAIQFMTMVNIMRPGTY